MRLSYIDKLFLVAMFCFLLSALAGCKTDAQIEHERCMRTAKKERESCRSGFIKTTKRIEMCQEIYEKDMKTCDG